MAETGMPGRIHVYNGGLRFGAARHILEQAGWQIQSGWPASGGYVGIWGASPTAWRGLWVARQSGAPILRIEDAFLRSVLPARMANDRNSPRGWRRLARRAPVGLILDPDGLHFDPARPCLFERLVHENTPRFESAREGIAFLRHAGLTKYSQHLPGAELPPNGCVLVVDQTRGDASLMGAGRALFLRMLDAARAENPGRLIVVRSHPETAAGLRSGHLTRSDLLSGEILHDAPTDPWAMLARAHRVYSVSSQLGYEAMLAGHRPRLFGLPFHAGWDLSDDEFPMPRAGRGRASIEALFTATHLIGPIWFDPCRDRICDFETAARQLDAEARAWRQDHAGHVAAHMRLWKRPAIAAAFGNGRGVRFTSPTQTQPSLIWAGAAGETKGDCRPDPAQTAAEHNPVTGDVTPRRTLLVEDGFIRSRGLGAALVPPLSLVADDLGIYYDASRPSRLEKLIAAPLPPGGRVRAEALIARLRASGLGKYNLVGASPVIGAGPGQKVILVPGQVADDASIRLGAVGDVRDNEALLAKVRAENPDAFLIYKPHPDVEAGLRAGSVGAGQADMIARDADPMALIARADAVWTLTSTLGFEALIRGVPVTCLGAPFYAGWGLTRDLAPMPARRKARPDLARLVHAALIAYPRYIDPVSGRPCPVEFVLDQLEAGHRPALPGLRVLSKLQGILASQSWIWR